MINNKTLSTKEKQGFFYFLNDFVDDNHIAGMGVKAYAVYSIIKRHANYAEHTAFPSYTTISERTGLNRTQIKEALDVLEQGHYLTIDKKKVKTGEQNHYTVIDFSDVKALTPKKGKNKLTKRVNGKQGQEAAAPKEKTQVEEVKIEELIATPSSSLYEAYKAAVMKHVLHSDVKLWSEKTFNTKAEKHDKAKLQIAYELLLKEQNKTSAKVYLLSPEQLISAYYPKVMNVITTRKADVEKEKAEELHKKVQEISFKEAASRGFVTESELKDFMELNGKLNTTQKSGGYNIRWDEIKPKMVEAYRAIKQEIQAASGF